MVDQLAASLESEVSLLTASRLRLEEAQEAMPPLREANAALPGILAAHRETRSALDELRSRQQRLLKDLGEAQAGLDRCLELEGRRQESVKALAEASLRPAITAFGKGGYRRFSSSDPGAILGRVRTTG